MRKFSVFIFLILGVLNQSKGQPCAGSSSNIWPNKCFEIVSILVDACDGNNEGQNEMIRLQIGSTPLLISGFSIPAYGGSGFVNWGAGSSNPWRGFANFNASTLTKITTINNSIAASGHCGLLIPLNNNQYVPSKSNLLIITSTSFNPTAQNFDNLMDTLYVVIQTSGNTAGHFANNSSGTPYDRKLIINHTICSDTVTYQKNLLLKQDLTNGAEDGGTVNFTFGGVDSYVNYGCAVPIPPITFDAGTAAGTFCSGAQVQLNGTVVGTNCFVWRLKNPSQGSLTDSTILNPKLNINSGLTSGSIVVYLALKYNCANAKDSVVININTANALIFAGNDTNICINSNLSLLANSTGVGNIQWSTNGTGNFSNPNSFISTYMPSASDLGTMYLKLTQQTTCGLVADSLKLTIIQAPNPNFTFPTGTICAGSSAFNLNPQSLGGVFSGIGLLGTNQFNPTTSGTFAIKYLTNTSGCKDSIINNILVTQKPNPNFAPSNLSSCIGSNPINLNPSQMGGIFSGTNVSGNQFLPAQLGTFPIKHVVTLLGCSDSSVLSIDVIALPDASFNPSLLKVCAGDPPIALNPTTIGGTFSGTNHLQGTNFIPQLAGSFNIKYIVSKNGCIDSSNLNLVVEPKPNAHFIMNDTMFCEGDPFELLIPTEPGGNFSGLHISGNTFNPDKAGKYFIKYFLSLGSCKDSMIKEVIVLKKPLAAFKIEPTIGKVNEPVQFTFTGQNANSFDWTFGNPGIGNSTLESPIFSFKQANRIEIKLIVESNGCYDTISQFLDIEGADTLILPNVFTPNGDSINDYFQPINMGINTYNIEIYNRWGGLVFSSNSILSHWDGTYNQEPCASGVYFYVLNASSNTGRQYKLHGTLTLLR
jgi:gliding motility-associated-like protein